MIRQPDRELLESACRGLADEVAAALARNWSDVHAAFVMTHLAREGWTFHDLWPYVHETIARRVLDRVEGLGSAGVLPPHGLAWVEDVAETEPTEREEKMA